MTGRLVVCTVGASLLETNEERNTLADEVLPLARAGESLTIIRKHLKQALGDIQRREAYDEGLRARLVEQYYAELARRADPPGEGAPLLPPLAGSVPQLLVDAARHLVAGVYGLWDSRAGTLKVRRQASPAELASLSLLDPALGPDDEVVLLYSDTPAGALCAACLEALLRRGISNLTRDGRPVPVQARRIAWLDPACREAFEQRAVGELAAAVADLYYRQVQPGGRTQMLLNLTGGYKAVVPILTLVAGLLCDPRVAVVCLFEDADQLLHQPVVPITLDDPDLVSELRQAGRGDPPRGVLARFGPGECPAAWRPYFAGTDRPALSLLGRAVQQVLLARAHEPERKS